MTRFKRPAGILLAAALALLSAVVSAPAARAEQAYPIAFTEIGIYPRVAPSMDADRNGDALFDGTMVTLECELEGQPVSNGMSTISVWAKTPHGYLPNAYLYTGVDGWTPGVPRCNTGEQQAGTPQPAAESIQRYQRQKAADYAVAHYQDQWEFKANCTAFLSKSLWSGEMPKHEHWTNESRWKEDQKKFKGFTKQARITDELVGHLTYHGMAEVHEISLYDRSAGGAKIGDIIAYDLKGYHGQKYDHLAIVTGVTEDGTVLRTQQTSNKVNAVWNNASDIERAYLVHITY